ncbi:SecD/SecF fusion protein [Haloferula luteola]|uniref:Multifunctional fusion protein n=1 Tax=Haloferula luteola TaxID=595692 RepID=A0A840V9P7_9BACT|nr:protein translocase subunit SecD [Haloferula luteola]MBB5350499.1 SecD/SecF fusion protein [Haloferula luteola]
MSPVLGVTLISDPLALFLSGLALLILFIWYFATDSDRRKRNVGTVLTLGVCALSLLALWPPKDSLKGGIDIVGGSAFTLKVKPNVDETTGEPIPLSQRDLDEAVRVIEKRLSVTIPNSEPLVVSSGTDSIIVQVPGMEPEVAAEVRVALQKVAKLELREVSNESAMVAKAVADGDEVVPGYAAFEHKGEDRDGEPFTEYLLLSKRTAISGSDVADAWPQQQGSDFQVGIKLTSEGGKKMENLTGSMSPGRDRIAVLLDGEVLTAPVVQTVPLGQSFVIQGQDSFKAADKLAGQLLNPLQNALEISEERSVSPTLGAAVVKQGLTAGVAGLAFTAIFLFIYYRSVGLIAVLALIVNSIIIFGAMALFNFTFTLPGIAGIVLTIGMAVDANVLIYERLREEIEAGKSLHTAIDTAYAKAFSAIFDSNITSLITAVILFWKASGTVSGFAVTLTIGLVGSMFSAILVTRVIFRWLLDSGLMKKVTLMNFFRKSNFDFLGKRRFSLSLSTVLVLGCLGTLAMKKEAALGVDFTGGSLISFQFPEGFDSLPHSDADNALKDLDLAANPVVQEERVPGSGELLTIRCAAEDAAKVEEQMRKAFPDPLATRVPVAEGSDETKYLVEATVESVSATAGKAFLLNSGVALGIGLLAIFVYIALRFEFAFALGAFLALIHDVIAAVGIVILLGGELSLIHVGAILTIAGYSINDTIIVFDRIRESLLTSTGRIKDLMNEALNATLSRTMLTSLTTIFTVAILAIFGSSGLRDFSVMILIGLVVGTYSSIFVASPVVLIAARKKNLREQVIESSMIEKGQAEA